MRFALLIALAGLTVGLAGCLNDRHLGDRTSEAFQKIFQEQARRRPTTATVGEGIPAEEVEVELANLRTAWQRAQAGTSSSPLLPLQTGGR